MASPLQSSHAGPSSELHLEYSDDPLPGDSLISDEHDIDAQDHSNNNDDPNAPISGPENGREIDDMDFLPEGVAWFGEQSRLGKLPTYVLMLWAVIGMISIIFIVLNMTYLFILLCAWPWYLENWSKAMDLTGPYYILLCASFLSWAPLIGVYAINRFGPGTRTACVCTIVLFSIFGLISWGYCALVSNTNASYITSAGIGHDTMGKAPFGVFVQAWSTGLMPQTPQRCDARVAPQQYSLFSDEIYQTQFARTYSVANNHSGPGRVTAYEEWRIHPAFNFTSHKLVQENRELCDLGFMGNTDLYGLGIRTGVYLQWGSSLLANNFLSSSRQEIQKV